MRRWDGGMGAGNGAGAGAKDEKLNFVWLGMVISESWWWQVGSVLLLCGRRVHAV